jgi:MFS family permease
MQKKITAYSIFIFILGAAFYFYDFVLQVSPGVMALSLLKEFQISASVLGVISGIYFYSYTLMQIPAGLMLDRYGARNVLPIVICVCALGALIFSMAEHFAFIGVGRLLMGAGSAFAFLGSLYLITRWIPVKYFAVFAGLTQMIGSLGAMGGETPLAYMISKIGWREAMLVFAIAGFIFAGVMRLLVKNEKSAATTARHTSHAVWANFKKVLRDQQTWMIGIYSFATWAPIACFAGLWGVPFLRTAYQLSNIQAANYIALLWLSIGLACPMLGWLSDTIGKRVILLCWVSGIGFVSTLGLIYGQHQTHIMIALELMGIGIAASGQSLAFAVINDRQNHQLTGAANGFNNMMIVLGGAIFQPLVGWMLDLHQHAPIAMKDHIYTQANFKFALVVLPCLYLLALLMAKFSIAEP